MIERQLEQLVQAYAAAKDAHDPDAALAFCHDDCFYESVPLGQRVQGKENLKLFYEALFQAFPDYQAAFDGLASGENSIVVWGIFRGTMCGPCLGIPPTGRSFEVPVVFVVTFRDGLIASDRGFFDLATLCEQLGIPLQDVRRAALPLPAASPLA